MQALFDFAFFVAIISALGDGLDLRFVRTRALILNEDSDATVVIGIAKISRAIRASVGYLVEFSFHRMSTSKSEL